MFFTRNHFCGKDPRAKKLSITNKNKKNLENLPLLNGEKIKENGTTSGNLIIIMRISRRVNSNNNNNLECVALTRSMFYAGKLLRVHES